MTYTRKIVHGAGAILIMSAVAGLISYGTRILLARTLGPIDYGLYSSVLTFVIFFLFFRDFGLTAALIKKIAEFKVQEKYAEIKTAIISIFSIQLVCSVVMGTVFFLLAEFLARSYFHDARAATILKLLILYVVFSVLFITQKSSFLGFQRNVLFGSFDVSKNLTVLLLTLLFFYFNLGVLAPILAYVFVPIVLFIFYLPFFLRTFPFFSHKSIPGKSTTKDLILFGLPVFASAIGGKVIGYFDTLFLTYFRTLAEVGIYNIILPSAMIFVDIGTAVGMVIFPLSSELSAKNDQQKLSAGLDLVHRYFFALVLPFIITITFFARYFIIAFFGEAYGSGTLAFQILLLGVLCLMVGGINNSIIMGMGHPKAVTKIVLWAALANVLCNLILIPRFGIIGAALATLVSYVLILILSTRVATTSLTIPFPLQNWGKIGVAGLGFTVTLVLLSILLALPWWLKLMITFPVAFMVYIGICFELKLFKFEEIKKYCKLVM